MFAAAGIAAKAFFAHPGTWFGAAALIASLTWGGWNWVRLQYAEAKLATAEANFEKVKTANEKIAGDVRECNAAVTGLAATSSEAFERAIKAIAVAVAENAKVAGRQQEIKVLLSQPTPAGADCNKGNAVVRRNLIDEIR